MVFNDGKFVSVDVPVAGSSFSNVNGINSEGNIVGRYNGPDGKTHGYFLSCVACKDHEATGRLN